MEWQQIIGFYHVANLRSFTKAAGATFRTQSALTQQIKALEEELDCPLFERIGKRKLLLTPQGERFLAFSQAVLAQYDGLLEELNELKGLQKGRLKLAAPFTTLYHLLSDTLADFIKQFPHVELSLFDRPQHNVIDLVKNGEIDFGIALESMVPQDLQKIRWKKVEPVLLIPQGHPLGRVKRVSMRRIAQYPLILPPKSSEYTGRRRLEELFQKYNLNYRMIMESSNVELSSLYVEKGLGISFATIVTDLPLFKSRKLEYIPLHHYFEPEYISVLIRKDKVFTSFKSGFLNILLGKSDIMKFSPPD